MLGLLALALAGCTGAPAPGPAPTTAPSTAAAVMPPSAPAAATPGAATPGATTPAAATPGAASTPTPSTPVPPLVEAAVWVTRSGVRALRVTPTTAGRAPGVRAEDVWAQLVRTHPDADTPGMRDQLACHVAFAAAKPAWFLEPARPAVGYPATVAAGCNPGSILDPG